MIYFVLFMFMGSMYFLMELGFDGTTHWTMIIVGGICGVLIGLLNEYKLKWTDSLLKQIFWGLVIIMPIEFISGCILNLWLKLDIWDYSHLPLNLLGQTSLTFLPVFVPCVLLAIIIDDWYRYWVCGRERPRYHLI